MKTHIISTYIRQNLVKCNVFMTTFTVYSDILLFLFLLTNVDTFALNESVCLMP